MAKRDYYEVLGVGRDADGSALKSAYRRLAMKYHPDRNPDDPEAEARFKEAKEAHDILSDSRKRAAYDQFGHAGVQAGNSADGGFSGAEAFSDIFGDVFGDIFGGGRRGARTDVYRGADLGYELDLSLEQAVRGDSVKIDIPTNVACERCGSSGAEPGTQPVDCRSCGGAGQVRVQQGFFTSSRPVRPVAAPARPSTSRAGTAADGAGSVSSARCPSRFRPASTTATGSACPARARPDATVGRPATCMSTSTCAIIRSSAAKAAT